MLHSNLERLIGTALIDQEFRSALLTSPTAAARGFGLSEDELGDLGSVHVETLEELAAHVHAWIVRAPKPRKPALAKWTLAEGLQLARAAG